MMMLMLLLLPAKTYSLSPIIKLSPPIIKLEFAVHHLPDSSQLQHSQHNVDIPSFGHSSLVARSCSHPLIAPDVVTKRWDHGT